MRPISLGVAILALLAAATAYYHLSDDGKAIVSRTTPPAAQTPDVQKLADGEKLFNAKCATCHGTKAVGTTQGPPLVHKIYEPSHHSDEAFVLAAFRGVRSHHWNFGNMPPVDGIEMDDMAPIVAYVRGLQRQAGIN